MIHDKYLTNMISAVKNYSISRAIIVNKKEVVENMQ